MIQALSYWIAANIHKSFLNKTKQTAKLFVAFQNVIPSYYQKSYLPTQASKHLRQCLYALK